MDPRLVGWARAVKARQRRKLPPLWLFTDPARMPDLEAAIAALPRGLCGVVFRHDGVAGRRDLLRRVARLCRRRRLALVVAGSERDLPPGAGRHLRGGRGARRTRHWLTSSAHDPAEIVRARRAGAEAIFLSPAFTTLSHPDARPLGPTRWANLSRRAGMVPFALGGIDGRTVRSLPSWAAGAGAIGALLP